MENPKQQLIERIKAANNVLVTVSANPSVDQLSAAIGLTLMLNKTGKHGTAVFSGKVPSTIEFLQPEKTLEKNTDSLRDFIIALDKSKADKLRYKVEEDHVKIFITPYRTSISDKDLEFSQGDFNVEVVVALGVTDPKDLDQAITAHGRILHDATTISFTTGQASTIGSINWADADASSLCEMVASIADSLQANVLDGQMATALMTGIVAETHRFSNEKTSPSAMSISAKLMAAGANQQLVASKLQEEPKAVEIEIAEEDANEPQGDQPGPVDGSLQISHGWDQADDKPEKSQDSDDQLDQPSVDELPEDDLDEAAPYYDQIVTDDRSQAKTPADVPNAPPERHERPTRSSSIKGGSSLVLEPPMLGGQLTANTEVEHLDPATDPLAGGNHNSPILSHQTPPAEEPYLPSELPDLNGEDELPGPSMTLPSEDVVAELDSVADLPQEDYSVPQTLSDIESIVNSAQSDPLAGNEPAPVAEYSPPNPTPVPTFDMPPIMPPAPEIPGSPEEQMPADETAPDVGDARDAVSAAIAGGVQPLPPIAALNAQPLDLEIRQTGETGILDHIDEETGIPSFTMPENLVPPITNLPTDNTATLVDDPTAPPPVPPPMLPGLDPTTSFGPLPVEEQPKDSTQNPFGLPPA